jgi:virginiamycin B lyase
MVDLQVPSSLNTACAGRGMRSSSVSGTVSVGPACGQISNPISVYPLVPPICGAQAYMPTSMTTGSDGALWFLIFRDNVIGRMTTAGVTTFYPIPFRWSGGIWGNGSITSGSDGAIWFIANNGNDIVRMTTDGTITNIYPLSPGYGADAITSGPNGALWLICGDHTTANEGICQLTTAGEFTYFPDPNFPGESGSTGYRYFYTNITTGPDGALWFTELATSTSVGGFSKGWIGRMTTSGLFSQFQIPFTFQPETLTAGPDGAIWFAGPEACGRIDVSTNTWECFQGIGRVTTSGVFTEYIGQGGQIGNVVASITTGPDGALWFTNYTVPGDSGYVPYPAIGRITTNGSITTYGNAGTDGTVSITPGPDGAMWFDDHLNDSIGRISVP